MCAPSAPPPPNYAQAAKVQGESNLEAARASAMLSNPNMNTPYGTRRVEYDGNIPTITDELSPVGQQQFDSQNRIINSLNNTAEQGLGRVSNAMGTPFDMSQVQGYSTKPAMTVDPSKLPGRTVDPSLTIDPSKASQYTVNPGVASYDDPIVKAMIERNQPEFDRRRSGTEADLLARGFNPGGSGFDARMADIGKQENDYRLAALLAGGQEQSRVAGLESQRRAQDFNEMGLLGNDQSRVAGLESQIRAQALGEQQATGQDQSRVMGAESSRRGQDIQEQAYLRQIPLTELNALRTGGMPNMPQFQQYQGSQVQAAPMMDATMAQGNYALQNYQNKLNASPMGGLFDLAGAGLGAAGAAGGFAPLFAGLSDRRLKREIKKLWKSGKHTFYKFKYLWDDFECIGVMADEVEKITPEAVFTVNGYKVVNYGLL